MARPSGSPRIGTIQPDEFANRAVQLAASRTTLSAPANPKDAPLWHDAVRIACYSRGEDDAPGATVSIEDALHNVLMAVYGAGSAGVPSDQRSSVCVVLLAASARMKLARGAAITTSELAAIAGLDTSTVRRMSREGRIIRSGSGRGLIDPGSASLYLSEQSVQAPDAPVSV